jgi:drug/metabolite transporter (DMT)-like permease
MIALGLALGASIAWGGSDFLAGLVARRLPVLTLLILSQAAGLVVLLSLLAATGDPVPPPQAAFDAAAAGVAEVIGFGAFYTALAIGPMSVVAPLASLAAIVPVVVGVAGGERPGTGTAIGLALALGCGALVAFERDPDGGKRVVPGAAMAVASALAFGAFFVGTDAASNSGGVAWTVAVNRTTSFIALTLVVLLGRRAVRWRSGDLRPAMGVGLLDAGANALFALALTEGMSSTVSVIGSMFPVTTVILGAILLRERPGWLQSAGVAGVLVGVGFVTAFGGA